MTAFLIVIAVITVIVAAVLSIKATVKVVYDKGWHTTVKVLFFEKEIVLSEILSMILKPKNASDGTPEQNVKSDGDNIAEEKLNKNGESTESGDSLSSDSVKDEKADSSVAEDAEAVNGEVKNTSAPVKKPNPIQKLWQDEGILGILSLVSNIGETANSAVLTLIRGLHIYSIYVMIIVGGGDAARIGIDYGRLCSYYYPVKGLVLNQMRVDNYEDLIQPDFIADKTDFEFSLIGSLSVGLLLKVGLKAGFIFLKNLIINKKGD